MDEELLQFIYKRCQTNTYFVSKATGINYNRLYCIGFYGYRITNEELDLLYKYLKEKMNWSDYFISRKFSKIKRRNNNGNIKGDR
jgi:hypothetical protein